MDRWSFNHTAGNVFELDSHHISSNFIDLAQSVYKVMEAMRKTLQCVFVDTCLSYFCAGFSVENLSPVIL